MKRLALILCACTALVLRPSPAAAALPVPGQCGLPSTTTSWIDFADGSVPFWETFARPGVIAAAANMIYPPRLRQAGAQTIYWDMYLKNRVGTPSAPADPAVIQARANKFFDYAAASSACATPLIAENELFGASLTTPWSATNARYRANVLLYLRTLAERGARPFLLVNSKPYTEGEAGEWWKQVAEVSDIVREVYLPAPRIYRQGPIAGSRALRVALRRGIADFTSIGIPIARLGVMLGFQTNSGTGGREGLQPVAAWYRVVKWQALAARQVAAETRVATVWSWGWGSWGERGLDPDKEGAACVWLWVRSPSLCDATTAAGEEFDASLTEGQLLLRSGVQCVVGSRELTAKAISDLQVMTGDRELAYTTLYARLVESRSAPVLTREVLAAERSVIASRFRGNRAAYLAELAKAHVTEAIARGVIGDELRRARIAATLPAAPPSAAAIASFYYAYPELLVRSVKTTPSPWWLSGKSQGLALSSISPPELFAVPSGSTETIRTMEGTYVVRPLGEATPLGALPLPQARPAIVAALQAFERGDAFERWSESKQASALRVASCARDDLPALGAIELSTFLPFLALTGA